MIVKRLVKKRTQGQHKSTSTPSYTSPKLPDKPKVTEGPRCYGRTRKGKLIVVRFIISDLVAENLRRRLPENRWWVIDMDDQLNPIAGGTNKEGYGSRAQAIKIAREYRNAYGAWAKWPF